MYLRAGEGSTTPTTSDATDSIADPVRLQMEGAVRVSSSYDEVRGVDVAGAIEAPQAEINQLLLQTSSGLN